ncbi:hypothetical protein C8Q79DRAFT_355100 [Trametes meyenii]|nr:hypothetical protein C8Q79DRAFT_355100 [Trametes meyenii]
METFKHLPEDEKIEGLSPGRRTRLQDDMRITSLAQRPQLLCAHAFAAWPSRENLSCSFPRRPQRGALPPQAGARARGSGLREDSNDLRGDGGPKHSRPRSQVPGPRQFNPSLPEPARICYLAITPAVPLGRAGSSGR